MSGSEGDVAPADIEPVGAAIAVAFTGAVIALVGAVVALSSPVAYVRLRRIRESEKPA